jgi:Glycosyl hydrolase catalytic core
MRWLFGALAVSACAKNVADTHSAAAVSGGRNAGGNVAQRAGGVAELAGAAGPSRLASAGRAADGGARAEATGGHGSPSAGATAADGGHGGRAGAGAGGTAGSSGMRPYKGVANSPCGARSALNVSWYYNWTETENEACSDGRGGEFVPMIWGKPGDEQAAASIASSVQGFSAKGYDKVLGFNEPDNKDQSNIPVAQAISLWPAFDQPGVQIGTPGTAANATPGQAWFKDFMTQLAADKSLRADFIAIHWYGWNAGSCDAKASQLEGYIRWAEGFPGNRPIWITEWGCLNDSAPDSATVVTFYNAALAVFAKHPRIERYAWYPWATNCHLNESDGSLTELGNAYAAAPSYRP